MNEAMLAGGLSTKIRQKITEEKAKVPKIEAKGILVLIELANMKAGMVSVEHIISNKELSTEQQLREIQRIKDQYQFIKNLDTRMRKLLGVSPSAKVSELL